MKRFLILALRILVLVVVAYLAIVWLLFGSQIKQEAARLRTEQPSPAQAHTVTAGTYQFTVNAVKRFRSVAANASLESSQDGPLVAINLTVSNISTNPETSEFHMSDVHHVRLRLAQGPPLERDIAAEGRLEAVAAFPDVPGTQDFPAFRQPLSPGASLTIAVVFDVPPQAKDATLVVADLAIPFRTASIFLSLPH